MPRGKMLGGTSSINSMNFIRGVPQDFDAWAEAGLEGWSYEDVLPYFKKYEGNQNEKFVAKDDGRYHSSTGPVKISSGPILKIDQTIMSLLNESGFEYFEDINAEKKCPGYTLLQKYSSGIQRSGAAYSFLAPAKDRKNLHVMKHAYVDRVLLDENNVAYGVEITYKGEHKMRVNCTKEVIASAGAIQSPTLLMRSGIGPKEHLKERGIPCKADLPVGENFMDHLDTFLLFKYNNITSKPISELAMVDAFYRFLLFQGNSLGSAGVLIAEVDTTNSSDVPDVQFGFSNIPQGYPKEIMEPTNMYTGLGSLNNFMVEANKDSAILFLWVTGLKPKSKGFIRLNETLQEEITSNFLTDASDRETLVRGINYFLTLTKSEAFQRAGTELLRFDLDECDELEYLSDEYWECYIKCVSNSIGHQVGTSKMGTDSKSVVDSKLRVYKTERLRQIDCGM